MVRAALAEWCGALTAELVAGEEYGVALYPALEHFVDVLDSGEFMSVGAQPDSEDVADGRRNALDLLWDSLCSIALAGAERDAAAAAAVAVRLRVIAPGVLGDAGRSGQVMRNLEEQAHDLVAVAQASCWLRWMARRHVDSAPTADTLRQLLVVVQPLVSFPLLPQQQRQVLRDMAILTRHFAGSVHPASSPVRVTRADRERSGAES